MAHMRAVVYHGPGDIRVESVPAPVAEAGTLRVKVDACAVCGTDLKSYRHGNPKITPPMIIGHELTGIVDTVGAGVEGFVAGDRIVMATSISCGRCGCCRRGWPNLCLDLAPMGFRYPGGMAQYTVIPERALCNGHVIVVPGGVQPVHAALAEPLSCAVNAAENCGIREGDTVVVVGGGPMGIMNACVAREFGAAKIMLAEVNPARLAQAQAFGFESLIDPGREDLAARVKRETDGMGADVAIVAAPAAAPQEAAVHLVRKRGTVCLFASLPAGGHLLAMDSRAVHYNELRVVGSSDSTPDHVRKAVAMIAGGSLPVDRLATHVMRLEDIFEAYALMERGESLRVVLTP